MARNHSPKPLYGAAKRTREPLDCSYDGCSNEGLIGYHSIPTYTWRCLEHRHSVTPTKVQVNKQNKQAAQVALLRSMGLA